MPDELLNINREHIEAFIGHLLERWWPATANNRFIGIQSFRKWAVEEGETKERPLARMRPSKVPESLPDVLRDETASSIPEGMPQGH
jgi:site-specific recombinase XerD